MHIVSRKARAQNAFDAWWMAYYRNGKWDNFVLIEGKTKEQIYQELVKLGDDPSPDDVDAVIGNNSWTSVHCDDCGAFCEYALEVGDDRGYDSNTATLCYNCIMEAARTIKTIKKGVK